MKPMKVTAGEHAPDLDELLEKAQSMDDMLAKVADLRDDSQMRNITGVEEAPMTHYWTNQMQPEEGIESVANKGAHSETISFDTNTNPHQTGSTLSAHENTAGGIQKASKKPKPDYLDMDGDGNKKESMKDALKDGKKVKKAGPLDALLGGGGGPPGAGGPPGGMPKPPMGGDKPPMGDMDDMGDDDPDELADRIKGLVDKLASKSGGPEKMPLPPGGAPGAGGPPGGMPKPPGPPGGPM